MLLDQLKYFPRGDHDDGPDALEMVLREAEINQVGFLPLTDDAKDRHGRGLNHPDFGRTTPEEDARDDDDENGVGAGIFAG
jgi:ethanolamine ammonia-lyase small subunit